MRKKAVKFGIKPILYWGLQMRRLIPGNIKRNHLATLSKKKLKIGTLTYVHVRFAKHVLNV